MAGPAVTFDGLKDFRRDLNEVDKAFGRELGKVQSGIARWLAPQAQAAASAMGGQQRHFAAAIRGTGGQTGARIGVTKEANAAFWGATKRAGWNAGHDGKPQFKPWVGASWQPGGSGGPYAINPTIHRNLDAIVERFADGVDEITRRAFPNGD